MPRTLRGLPKCPVLVPPEIDPIPDPNQADSFLLIPKRAGDQPGVGGEQQQQDAYQ